MQPKFRKVQPRNLGSLQAAIGAFIQEHHINEGVMPSTWQLEEANRLDIVDALRQHGGRKRVAASMQLQGSHSRLKFPTIALAATALQLFAKQHHEEPQIAPSFTELRQAGRQDLIVSYRKFGQARLLEAAGMKPCGRKSKHLLVCSPSSLLFPLQPLHLPLPLRPLVILLATPMYKNCKLYIGAISYTACSVIKLDAQTKMISSLL